MPATKTAGVLRLDPGEDQGTDYILADGASAWITVGNISVWVQDTGDGVSVDICPNGHAADGNDLANTRASFAEAQAVIDGEHYLEWGDVAS